MLVELNDDELESVAGGLAICVVTAEQGTTLDRELPAATPVQAMTPGTVGNCD